ncbi:hypothetical protein [Yeosuana sp.]|uniref:hypothetical protein n=1 Tax=Yeosuana sp. TaxID=2529388 RepID=UPI004054B61D
MIKTKYLFVLLIIGQFHNVVSQTVEISGKIDSKTDVENINIINKTSQYFTISNKDGEFKILAKLNDTLMFSSMLHKPKSVIVDNHVILFKAIRVTLDEQINELAEVTVGKLLTGDLFSDINNTTGKPPINFYDVGIPGYTGKIATQSERRLNEASTGSNGQKLKWYSPLTGAIPLNPIINAISGRTKMLKQRIEIEDKEELMLSIKAKLSKDFFVSNPLEDDLKMDFFYFCADDENFIKHCKHQTDFKILIFLRMKYRQYVENLNDKKD